MSDEDLKNKFMDLTSRRLGNDKARELIKFIQRLEVIKDITELTEFLRKNY
jgi:hypothetical protein